MDRKKHEESQPDERDDRPQGHVRVRPPWAGPPIGQPGVRIPLNRTIARSTQAQVALVELQGYPEGCVIEIEADARTIEESPGDLIERCTTEAPDGPPDSLLRFSVLFRDRHNAATTDHILTPTSEPEPPVLLVLNGAGYGIDGLNIHTHQQLWLWPAPTEPFDFTVEWPAFDVPLTLFTINIEQIFSTAQRD